MVLSLWRDISVVWLSILCLIGLVVPLAISYLAVSAMHRLLNVVPKYLNQSQRLSASIRSKTVFASRSAAEPVVKAEREVARALTIWRKLWPLTSPQPEAPGKGYKHAD